MAIWGTLKRASTFITIDDDADVTDGETVVVGGKTYTFQTTLTDVDGNVQLGQDHQGTAANLVAAINLGSGAGVAYADSMTRNPAVYAEEDEDTVILHARVPGTIGNAIPVDAGTSAVEPDNDLLEGGEGDLQDYLEALVQRVQLNAEALHAITSLTPAAD